MQSSDTPYRPCALVTLSLVLMIPLTIQARTLTFPMLNFSEHACTFPADTP
jgi:hypothetical protein